MNNNSQLNIYYHSAIIGANIIWGLYATICKGFLCSGLVSGWALCGLKMIGGTILFWTIAALLPHSVAPKERIAHRDMLKLFLASMLINAGSQSCIILGLEYTSPVDGTVICSMAPIFTLALAALLMRQRISLLQGVGVLMGFIGALLFIFPLSTSNHTIAEAGDNPLLGNALMIASQIFGALYLLLFTNVLSRYSAITIVKWLFLFSAIVLLPATAKDIYDSNWTDMDVLSWLQLGYIIVFATGIAYLLLIIGQKKVSPTSIAIYNYLQPVTAMISSVTIGLATINSQEKLATLLCLAGVYIVIRK